MVHYYVSYYFNDALVVFTPFNVALFDIALFDVAKMMKNTF